jgi:hypothetical protein
VIDNPALVVSLTRATATMTPTAADVEVVASSATIDSLLLALDEGAPYGNLFGRGEPYACPNCQGDGWHPAQSAPCLYATTDLIAECERCHARFTIFQLRRLVTEDADALGRLVTTAVA